MPVKRVPAPVKDELLTGTVKQEAVSTWGKRNRRGQSVQAVYLKKKSHSVTSLQFARREDTGTH